MILEPHIATVPQKTLSKSERKQVYKKPNRLSQSWQNAVSQKAMRRALDLSPAPGEVNRVLELGCGRGAFFCKLMDLYPEAFLIGVELNQFSIKEAQRLLQYRKGHWLLSHGAPQRLNMPSSSVDLVHCHYLLHQLPLLNRLPVLEEAVRVLKPGGKLLLSDFCASGIWSRPLWRSLSGNRNGSKGNNNCGWLDELPELGLRIKSQTQLSQNAINSYVIKAQK